MEQEKENSGNIITSQNSQEQGNSFYKKIWPFLTVLIIVVILFLGFKMAWNSGKNKAQNAVILNNTTGLQEALNFFYNDQDRFPTTSEFNDRNIMIQYLNLFPPNNFISKICSQSFVYKRISKNSYNLNFCLPKKESGFTKGWNLITISR